MNKDKKKKWNDFINSQFPDNRSLTTWELYCCLRDAKLKDSKDTTGTVYNFMKENPDFEGTKKRGIMFWSRKTRFNNPLEATPIAFNQAGYIQAYMDEHDK